MSQKVVRIMVDSMTWRRVRGAFDVPRVMHAQLDLGVVACYNLIEQAILGPWLSELARQRIILVTS